MSHQHEAARTEEQGASIAEADHVPSLRGSGLGALRERNGTPQTRVQPSEVTGLRCADIVDAMGRILRGHRCHILDLVSPTPERTLFGPAVTISYYPSGSPATNAEQHNFSTLFYEAVGDDPAGKVLVLASNGYPDTSLGGGTKLLRLQQNGCAGLLTDGRLRDFDELAEYDFAAYCSGETTRWGGDDVIPFLANVPVVVGRVGVIPGHYVFADSSGAVVIPAAKVEEVLELAFAVQAQDQGFRESIQMERPTALPKANGESG
jgi:4-hydroxy-4-methyl-2-oxoglutarate aldolase